MPSPPYAAELLGALTRSAKPPGKIAAPEGPGVYAWFLDDPSALPAIPDRDTLPIYVGMSSDLRERGDETHFSDGGSGFSSLRRSLGALLKEELRLRARPRGPGASRQNYLCYLFDASGEARLTSWMLTHLRVGVAEHPDPDTVEKALIKLAEPPLNLTHWPNPWRPAIKHLRGLCVLEAEQHRPPRWLLRNCSWLAGSGGALSVGLVTDLRR